MWKTASGKQTLYRGLSLRGVNQDDEMIDAMRSDFEGFIVRFVRDSVAKGEVSQWSMRQGDRGRGVGVHWSSDLPIAKSFSMTFGPEFIVTFSDSWLSVVIEATYTPGDEVANPEQNSHAYGWDGRDEKEVPLRAGAPLTLVKVHALVPSNITKFLAAYDEEGEARTKSVKWITIPLGFSAVAKIAGIIPATTSTNGPFRTVVNVEQGDRGIYTERLECGHTGKTGWKAEWLGTTVDGKPSKRRCYDCLSSDHKSWLNERPGSQGHVCSDACILPVSK